MWPPFRRCFSLFGSPLLAHGFPSASALALRACQPHIDALVAHSGRPALTLPQARDVLQRLDVVSNALCSVLDAAEACRSLSHSAAQRESAHEAYTALAAYMHSLNGCAPLYTALGLVAGSPSLLAGLTQEEARLAHLLRVEFERDGIARPASVRQRIGAVQGELGELSQAFLQGLQGSEEEEEAAGGIALPPGSQAALRTVMAGHSASAATCSLAWAPLILRCAPHAPLRAAALRATHSRHAANMPTLEALRGRRAALARLAGAPCFVSMQASDRVLGSGLAAARFLRGLARALLPRAALEAHAMAAAKHQGRGRDASAAEAEAEEAAAAWAEGSGGASSSSFPARLLHRRLAVGGATLQPWDTAYYGALAAAGSASASASATLHSDPSAAATAYLPLDAALHGLTRLMHSLFAMRMQPRAFGPGEAWGSGPGGQAGLLRYDCSHETQGPLGTLYLDLFPREHKFGGAAHFVVRCGKQLHAQDAAAGAQAQKQAQQQLPVIVLALNIDPGSSSSSSSSSGAASAPLALSEVLLTPGELETLYHEWGHAMHSLLSRTHFQHTSGTRGPLDAVEVPSHLFEYWARDYDTVAGWARHSGTQAPLPRELWQAVQAQRAAWRGTELLQLCVHALYDLGLFGGEEVVREVLAGLPGVGLGQAEALAQAVLAAAAEGQGGEGPAQLALARLAEQWHQEEGAGICLLPAAPTATVTASTAAAAELLAQQPSPPPSHSATALLEAVALRYSITPPLKGSQWGGGFSHLCHYGGGYYTYAVAAVVSAALWQRLFAGGRASSRASGELLVRELLVHGGGRDARELLRACLGGAGVQAVGPQALMQEVWAGAQPGRLQGR